MKRLLLPIFCTFTSVFTLSAEGVLPWPGHWVQHSALNAASWQLADDGISGLNLTDEKCKVASCSARQQLIPARRGDFTASTRLVYDQYDGDFSGEVMFRLLDANGGLIAEVGLRDRWGGDKGLGKSHGTTVADGHSRQMGSLPVKGVVDFKIERQKDMITIHGNNVTLNQKSGNTAPVAFIEIFYQEYRGGNAHSGNFKFTAIQVKNQDTTFQNGFDDRISRNLPPQWRLTRRVGTSGFEIADDPDGMVITGLKDFPGYPAKESTHLFLRKIKPLNGDFTATLDMEWELPPDNSFVGSISLSLLDAAGKEIAATGLFDGNHQKPGTAGAIVEQVRQPSVNLPDKAAKEFMIRRTGDRIDIFCGSMQLESLQGSTAPVCAVRLGVWIGRRYDENRQLISSFLKKLTIRRIALIDRALPAPDPVVPPLKKFAPWQLGEPMTGYWAGPNLSDEFAAELAHGNWNIAWGCSVADLDVLYKHGLRGILWMSFSPLGGADAERRFRLWMQSVIHHPAFYGIYLADEPRSGAHLNALKKIVDWIRREYPGVMVYTNMHPLGTEQKFLGGNGNPRENYLSYMNEVLTKIDPEFMSYDKYTFAPFGDESGYFVNLKMFRDMAQKHNKPFVNIVQACTWTSSRRVVRGDEYRFLAYTTLAYGSQGLFSYVYSHPTHRGGMKDPFTGQNTGLYDAARIINREFTAIAGELQQLKSLNVYHAGEIPFMADALPADAPFNLEPAVKNYSDGKVEAIQPKADGKNYLSWSEPVKGWLLGYFGKNDTPTHVLLVNLDYNAARTITLTAPGNIKCFEPFRKCYYPVNSSKFKLTLPPGGGQLLALEDIK